MSYLRAGPAGGVEQALQALDLAGLGGGRMGTRLTAADWLEVARKLGEHQDQLRGEIWEYLRKRPRLVLSLLLGEPAGPAMPPGPGPVALGMVGEEWHGPTPPGPGWVLAREGPRGGKVWRKALGGSRGAAPRAGTRAPRPSSVPGYPKPAARNGRDQDASGLPARDTQAQRFGPWDPDERAAAVAALLRDVGGGKPGSWTQANATALERLFAEVLNFDHWDATFPTDIAGVVKIGPVARRVGIDLKAAVTQSAGTIKRDDHAELQKINFTVEDFDRAASGGADESLMFFLAVNANHTVKQVPDVDPATGQARRDARGQPVMRRAALLYLEAGVRGGRYGRMIPIEVEGLDDVSDLTDATILARVREKILAVIRNTDPAQFAEQVRASGEKLYERTTKRRARDLDTLAGAGVAISDQEQALRTAGQALKKADQALKERRDLRRQLQQQVAFLQGLYATAQGPMRMQIADQLARLGVQV
jgi:hypothetical protein